MIGKNVLLNKILEIIKNNLTDISREAKKSYEKINSGNNLIPIERLILKNKHSFKNISQIAEQTLDFFRSKK